MWQADKEPGSWQCLDGLKELKPGSARNSCRIRWILQNWYEVGLAPGQLSIPFPGANCTFGESMTMWSICRAVVHYYCALQREYLYHRHSVCNISLSSVLSLARDKWAAGECSEVSAAISSLKIPLCLVEAVRRGSGHMGFSLSENQHFSLLFSDYSDHDIWPSR